MPYPEVLPDAILLTLIGLFELGLGIYFLVNYQRTRSVVIFGCFIISVSLWVLGNGVSLFVERTSTAFDLISRVAFAAPLFAFAFVEIYTTYFPINVARVPVERIIRSLLPAVIISLLIFFSHSMVGGFIDDKYGSVLYGPDFWLYALYIIGMYLFCVGQLIHKRGQVSGHHKKIIELLLFGILLSGFIAILFSLVIDYFLRIDTWYPAVSASSIIWAVLVGRKILQRN